MVEVEDNGESGLVNLSQDSKVPGSLPLRSNVIARLLVTFRLRWSLCHCAAILIYILGVCVCVCMCVCVCVCVCV